MRLHRSVVSGMTVEVRRSAGRLLRLSFLLTILTSLSPTFLRAQAWTKGEGEIYTKLAYGSSTASQQFTFDGRTKEYADNVEGNAFFDRSLYLYGEAGITPDFTMVGGLAYKRTIIRDAAFRYRTFALGNLQIGGRYAITKLLGLDGGAEAFAVNGSLSIPTGYSRNRTPSAGGGQLDAELNLSYGHSFYPAPVYLQAAVGYRFRSDIYAFSTAVPCSEGIDKDCFADTKPSFGDEMFGGIEGGVTIADRVLIQALVNSTWSIAAPETGFTVSNPVPTQQRFIKVGGGVAASLWKGFGISTQIFFTPYGRNSINSMDLFFGIDYRMTLGAKPTVTP